MSGARARSPHASKPISYQDHEAAATQCGAITPPSSAGADQFLAGMAQRQAPFDGRYRHRDFTIQVEVGNAAACVPPAIPAGKPQTPGRHADTRPPTSEGAALSLFPRDPMPPSLTR